ncbi:Rrf2 family transcriptional regulator [Acerihabitans arboris]|uniref:Rrf2 family transcriptional regulator n=1 Tax=Acerihabitans arboris TaxID=2691583 RepID=A0A845SAJ3_9GAMM|nr:Rrf2 family transcriptional regulator [Acerihabitans arboris]NDL61780.1 Rrf2 family transcriptional regulator [Acerihabitans arboris]
MKLTRYTDYAVRVIIYLGAHQDRLSSIAEISRQYDISHNNLMKVVQDLARLGYIDTLRGRNGGIKLGRAPRDINIGALIRHTEKGDTLIDCANCVIAPACGLPGVLAKATNAFFAVLDGYTLADLLGRRDQIEQLFTFIEIEG